MIYQDIEKALQPYGLICRGGFALTPETGLQGTGWLVMVGNAGPDMWNRFSEDLDAGRIDDETDPMDQWTRSVIEDVAAQFDAKALYPFEGPPYYPFQQWAMRAEPVFPSPIGPLIHPRFGLWHAYRAALLLGSEIEFPKVQEMASPCETCSDKPCLQACPAGAFAAGSYDVPACVAHLLEDRSADCNSKGCLSRHACPVGQTFAYHPEQAQFHMDKFVKSQSG